jgi:hypothetical protein
MDEYAEESNTGWIRDPPWSKNQSYSLQNSCDGHNIIILAKSKSLMDTTVRFRYIRLSSSYIHHKTTAGPSESRIQPVEACDESESNGHTAAICICGVEWARRESPNRHRLHRRQQERPNLACIQVHCNIAWKVSSAYGVGRSLPL